MGRGSVYWVPPSVVPGAGDGRSTRLEHNIGNIGLTGSRFNGLKPPRAPVCSASDMQLAASRPHAVLFNGTDARWRGGCDLRPVSALAHAAKAGTWKLGTGISQTTPSGRGADNLDPNTRAPMFNIQQHAQP